jgi:4-hydroxy-tetrahydrodipicolinate synthase
MRSPQIDLTEEEVKELDDKLNSIRPKSSV